MCFVASTITDAPEELKIICKKLKKNNIALDLIAIGDLSDRQRETLQAMHETVKGAAECQLLVVEPGGNLSDVIFTSQIVGAEAGPNPNNQQMLNEENDPELMMALQLSLQEEEARVAAARGAGAGREQELEQQALQLAMEEEGEKKEGKEDDKEKKE